MAVPQKVQCKNYPVAISNATLFLFIGYYPFQGFNSSGKLEQWRVRITVYTYAMYSDRNYNASKVIALPSVKYSGQVEVDVIDHNLGRARRFANQPVAKIITNPEPCIAMMLEKLQKSSWSLVDGCLYLKHIFKDQPWLLWESGEMSCAV